MTARDLLNIKFNPDSFAKSFSIRKFDEHSIKLLENILKKHSVAINSPSPEDIKAVYDLFIRAINEDKLSQFESPRRCRKLAWAMTYIIKEKSHLEIAINMIDKNYRPSCMLGIFDSLLFLWENENIDILQIFLKKHLAEYEGKNKLLNILKLNQDYYCNKDSLTKAVISMQRQKIQLSEIWEWLGLPEKMHGYSYFGELGLAFIALSSSLNRPFIEDVVRFLKKHNNDQKNKKIVSILIEKLGIDAEEFVREPLQAYALQKWLDPRFVGGDVKWYDISEEARNIFIGWLNKKNLVIFFDVVAKACNDEKFADRRDFWLSYIRYISFCRPILRSDTKRYLTNDLNDPIVNQSNLIGGTRDQNVFIIQMGDYIFVEFSTVGACYVYHKDDCPFLLNKMRYRIEEFRDWDKARYRQVHIGSWEYSLSAWIQEKLGIMSTKY